MFKTIIKNYKYSFFNTDKKYIQGINKHNIAAFTLIELLIVVALTGVAIAITADILVSVTRSYNKTQVANELEQQATFVSSKLAKELRDAVSVSVPAAVDASGSELTFLSKSTSVQIRYTLNNGILYRQEGTSASLPLTSNTGVEGVVVECASGTSCFTLNSINPYIVSYSLVFKKNSITETAKINVSDTVVLRGTY